MHFKKETYFPLVKVDESSRTISGLATAEVPDKDGEICDYAGAKKNYAAWAAEASASTGAAGQEVSYGNIRKQHSLEIAGKAKEPPQYLDDAKEIHLVTQPIDEATFQLAKQGFIRGFSQAGDYEWRKCNDCSTSIPSGKFCPVCKTSVAVRYSPIIAEVSYVDNPCLKNATFSLVKADGTSEVRHFPERTNMSEPAGTTVINNAPAVDVQELARAVAAQLKKSVKYLITGADGETHLPYTDENGKPNHNLMGAAWAALHGGYRGNKYQGPDKDKAIERLKGIYAKEGTPTPPEKASKILPAVFTKALGSKKLSPVAKGLYTLSAFAEVLESMASIQANSVWERMWEADESKLPEDLQELLEAMATAFLAMAEEETTELTEAAAKELEMSEEVISKAFVTAAVSDALKAHGAETITGVESLLKSYGLKKAKDPGPPCPTCGTEMKCMKCEKADGNAGDQNSRGTVDPVDPMTAGTHSPYDKAATQAFIKQEIASGIQTGMEEFFKAIAKAANEDDDAEDEVDSEGKPTGKKKQKAIKASAGIGDRSQPAAGTQPNVTEMPRRVTKTDDGTNGAPAVATDDKPLTKGEIERALNGDTALATRLMKNTRHTDTIPATVASGLTSMGK